MKNVSPLVAISWCLLLSSTLWWSGCGDAPANRPVGYDATGRARASVARSSESPNFVVVVIDSLRADAVTSSRMPGLASRASRAVTFTEAASSAPWTLPSMTSLLTGRLPSEHGLQRMEGGRSLPPEVATFAEVLRETGGYETAAFVSGPWFETEGASLLQGFDVIGRSFTLQGFDPAFERWARFRRPDRPFLLLLHAYDAHMPYGAANHPYPPRRAKGGKLKAEKIRRFGPVDIHRSLILDYDASADLAEVLGDEATRISMRYGYEGWAADPDPAYARELRKAYWDGVAWTDGLLERALQHLERRGMMRNTVLAITSDHGEAFGEHGVLGHGLQLHDELVRVPLVVQGPPPFERPALVDSPVGLIDLFPTLLDVAGLPPLARSEGRSLLPVLARASPGHAVISEEVLGYHNTATQVDASLVSARTAHWKYVVRHDRRSGALRESAYDLTFDGEEAVDLAVDGRVEGVPFDPLLCEAVERIRDRFWEPARAAVGRSEGTLMADAARTATEAGPRPRPCAARERR